VREKQRGDSAAQEFLGEGFEFAALVVQ